MSKNHKKKTSRKFLRLRLVFLIVLLFDVVPELLASRRVTELAQSLCLDLADTFTGDVELLADFLKGVRMAVGESEAHREHALLTGSEGLEHMGKLLLKQGRRSGIRRGGGVVSLGSLAPSSGMKSPRWLSSSSPMGVSRETGS